MPNRLVSEVIGQRAFPTATHHTSVRDAAIIMKEWHSSAILVVENNYLVGICTERDIVFRVVAGDCNPAQTTVASVMTKKPQTIGPDKPFGHALHLMYEGGFRHLPVLIAPVTPSACWPPTTRWIWMACRWNRTWFAARKLPSSSDPIRFGQCHCPHDIASRARAEGNRRAVLTRLMRVTIPVP